jgi:nuclear pore complex protein Nup155
MKFRDLVSSEEGFQVVKSLVEALIQDARVDSISQILAARCPSFFSEADRTRYQGFELMTKAKYAERFDEKESYLRASLELFKKIPDHLNRQDVLQAITEEYQYLRYYEGAVILALECANAADPSGAGFTWFQEGMSDKDERGKTAYQKRIKTYSNIIRVLDELHTGAFTGLVTDRSVPRPTLDATELENEKLKVIKACRKSTDELFHIVLYKWYLSQNLDNELLQLQTPYLEVFLRKYSENKTQSMDLLWKYYVRQKKYAAAAVILAKLAETKEPAKLEIRIENLARAITNAKSAMDQHQLSNQVDGELLHDLEEKMEVARIQLKIYNDLQQIADLKLRDQARAELDTQLYTVSELYNRYVKNYGLCESALAIIHVSRHNDPILIKKLWENIIADELNQVQHEYKIAPLVNKLLDLGRAYSSSEITFPVEFLVEILERKSIELKRQWERSRNSFDISWVVNTMLDIGIPHHRLFFAYNDDLLEKTDPFWKDPANQFHLIDVLCVLLDRWIKHVRSASVSAWDIKQFRSKHVDTGIEKLVTRLHALKIGDAKADQLSSKLRTLKKEVLDFKPNPYTLTPMRQF